MLYQNNQTLVSRICCCCNAPYSSRTLKVKVVVGSFFWFQGKITWFEEYVQIPDLSYYLTPVIILTLATYLLACVFFSVYSMAVDTLFLCFLEDLEMNDGSPEKPYYMSKGLMSILGKKNKEAKPDRSEQGAKKK